MCSTACASDDSSSRDTAAAGQAPDVTTASRDTTPPTRTAQDLWFRRARAIDLTGDGVLDSAVVEARGQRSDSLRLAIAFIVGGERLFSQEWHSSYELALLDSLDRHPPRSDERLRAALTKVLASVRLRQLDTSYVRDFPADTAALPMARRGPVQSIFVAYGYETAMSVVWDPQARRFFIAHSCC